MAGGGTCPDHVTLAAFLYGKLPPAQEDVVNQHLAACPSCEARAQQLEAQADPLIDALRHTPTPVAPAPGGLTMGEATPLVPPNAAPFELEGYRIVEKIGHGGMGVVYRAHQHRLNRVVAIKMILAGELAHTESRVRFLMEGELLARLRHPHFVQVIEVGTVQREHGLVQPYLVMEHVDGGNLQNRLAGKPQPFDEAARMAAVLARAMDAAHAQGIVHRDLKPANVLLARDGTLKISDFGLAKEVGSGGSLTPAGVTVGTPGYMSPEQARGEVVGPAADVYALGAILYELLTGRPPFVGDTPVAVVMQVMQQAPVPVRHERAGVPRDLEIICLKCLEKEPGRRYQRAGDLADDLECWLDGKPIRARPASTAERAAKWMRRHPLPAALVAFLVLSLVGGSAVSTYFGVTAVEQASQAEKALAKEAQARSQAELATEAERWERYVAEIGTAGNALQLHNVLPARRSLQRAPLPYRNWEWRHLNSLLDGARTVLEGHDDRVTGVSFSPDRTRLASSSADRTVRLWDTASGKQVAELRIPAGEVAGVQFSPDGQWLVSGTTHVRVWNAATGALRWESAFDAERAACPTWSPDGRSLAACASDGWMRLWDAETGKPRFTRACNPFRFPVSFSPDSRLVASADSDYTVHLWDTATGKDVQSLRGHTDICSAMAYSPDGRRIATASIYPENALRVWDPATGKPQQGVGTGHVNEVSAVCFSPDGTRLASGASDQTVRLWDAATCRLLNTLEGHTNSVTHVVFSPDGKLLLSASPDQTLRLWDPTAGQLVAVLRGHDGAVRDVAISRNGALIASGADDHTVRLWDTAILTQGGVLRGHKSFVYDVAFRPDGHEVASAAWDGMVLFHDPTTGRETAPPLRHGSYLPALAYSPDGRHLGVVVREDGVFVWDVSKRAGNQYPEPVKLWKAFARPSYDTRLAFQPRGTLLAWGSPQGDVRLWDLARGAEAAVIAASPKGVQDVAFRPDGQQLAAACNDGLVRLWHTATRRLEGTLEAAPYTQRLAYSSDGRLLAAGAPDRTLRLWSIDTLKSLGTMTLGSTIYGVSFTPDGTRLACACADNTIRLVDVATLREVAELRGHRYYVHAVQFSPDGTRLASASGDLTVRIWDTLSMRRRIESLAR